MSYSHKTQASSLSSLVTGKLEVIRVRRPVVRNRDCLSPLACVVELPNIEDQGHFTSPVSAFTRTRRDFCHNFRVADKPAGTRNLTPECLNSEWNGVWQQLTSWDTDENISGDAQLSSGSRRTYSNPCPVVHSSRSRIAGSMESARCAGIHVATSPNNDIARTVPTNTNGSRGDA
jgi:hypothetical protein